MENLAPIDADLDVPTRKYVTDADALKVSKSGDTMSGNLTTPLANVGFLQIDRAAGLTSNIEMMSGGVLRWTLGKSSDAETGSDTGSNLNVASWTDAGNWKATVISIRRDTGDITLSNRLFVNGRTQINGDLQADWMEMVYGGWSGANISMAQVPTAADHLTNKTYVDSKASPPGAIIMFGSATPPAGWLLCNGQAITQAAYPDLYAVVGANVPDLRDRFIVGAGGAYAQAATGGAATVTLSAAESGTTAHAHTATSAAETTDHTHTANPSAVNTGTVSADHSHSGTSASGGPTHTHDDSVDEGITTGDSNDWVDSADDDTTGVILRTNIVRPANTAIGHTHTLTTGGISANHVHSVDLPAITGGGRSAAHTHGITVAAATAAAASAAHENRPPYYAVTFIIKF